MLGRFWIRSLVVGAGVLFAAQAIVACNNVLGIEPAELTDTSQEQLCQWSPPKPGVECTGCDEACVNNRCKLDACLIDPDCRYALFNFRGCVGTACTDAKGECACILASNKQAAEVAQCLKGCAVGGGDCNLSAANTLCQGYCSCMQQQCPTNEPNGGVEGGCLEACMAGLSAGAPALPFSDKDESIVKMWQTAPSPPQVGCLWFHCVAAETPNDPIHCAHAINRFGICTNPPVPNPQEGLCNYPQRHSNAPCNQPSQCCSGVCNGQSVCD